MAYQSTHGPRTPISEKLKGIPGFFGIRLAEEPRYKVLDMDGDKEVREYEKMILAYVTVPGAHHEAMKEGYDRLTRYLLGENATSLEMPMTMPVYEEHNHNTWTFSFILPREVTTASAPTALDHSIMIAEKASHKAAVIWYTGDSTSEKVYTKSAELREWLLTKTDFSTAGAVKIARYDGPKTLPFFRRNELQIEVVKIH